jgi:hypothetical protein
MRAAKIAALVALTILALTYATRAGIGMWNHAHPPKVSLWTPQAESDEEGVPICSGMARRAGRC